MTTFRAAAARAVWAITFVLAAIGTAIVMRRMLYLLAPMPAPSNFPETAALNAGFAQYPLLTMVHILPGLIFIVLAPLQFMKRLRIRRPRLHRWVGRAVLFAGLITGISALFMSTRLSIGGVNETAATMLFAVVFLFALARAYVAARRRKFVLHREWMIRAFAVGSAVAFIRPIVGVFFATRRITHLMPHDFFGTAFWLGFTIEFMAAEIWINYTRPAAR